MNRDPDIRVFHLVARRHLESAHILLRAQAYADAVYLAGYGVESNLKALLLANTPTAKRKTLVALEFRGTWGHDLAGLRNAVRSRGINIPSPIADALRIATSWSPNIRYRAARVAPRDAERFIASVGKIDDWTRGQLS